VVVLVGVAILVLTRIEDAQDGNHIADPTNTCRPTVRRPAVHASVHLRNVRRLAINEDLLTVGVYTAHSSLRDASAPDCVTLLKRNERYSYKLENDTI
jgi:hypothetical protein